MMPDQSDGNPYRSQEPTGRLNYWGYGEGFYFAPKASYSSGELKRPAAEFCSLVKELHQNGLELIVELYFTGKENPSLILEAVRFWVMQYHVDGVHLSGYAPAGLLVRDHGCPRQNFLQHRGRMRRMAGCAIWESTMTAFWLICAVC